MNTIIKDNFTPLNVDQPIWDTIYMVAPLVLIGTKEDNGYDLAPKHMVTPLGYGNYFGFVCTPRHNTYQNIKKTSEFTVSFPTPDQLLMTSLSASPRTGLISKSKGIIEVLPIVKATTMDAPLIEDAYLYLECELLKFIDGFDENSLIAGKIKAAYAHPDYLRLSEIDEQQQINQKPLLAYVSYGRFATITDTYNFPFPKGFKR